MFIVPFILVFPEFYENKDGSPDPEDCLNPISYPAGSEQPEPYVYIYCKTHKNFKAIENTIDIIYMIEIILNFFKKTRPNYNL